MKKILKTLYACVITAAILFGCAGTCTSAGIVSGLTNDSQRVSYDGQYGQGYGGIYDPVAYLKDRYGGTVQLQEEKILPMDMSQYNDTLNGEYIGYDCGLHGMTTMVKFYADQGLIDETDKDVIGAKISAATEYYNRRFKFKELGLRLTDNPRTVFLITNLIIKKVYKDYGLKNATSSLVISNFNTIAFNTTKKEINAGRVLMLGYMMGAYQNHGTVVNGYQIYTVTNGSKVKTHRLLAIHDGWNEEQRFVDCDALRTEAWLVIMYLINPKN